MAYTLDDFVGTYTIRFGSQSPNFPVQIEPGWKLMIGQGFALPTDGTRVGVALAAEDESGGWVVVLPSNEPDAFAYLTDGALSGSFYRQAEDRQIIVTFQISLMRVRNPDRGIYRAPTIALAVGDPENAGVWGADDGAGGAGGAGGGTPDP